MRSKWMSFFGVMLLAAALWGCGSNGGGGGSDVPPPGGGTPPGDVGSTSCTVCHFSVVAQGWTASFHDSASAGCEGCHGGGQFHVAAPTNVAVPYPEPALVQCDLCHDVTVRHINGDDPATSYQTTPSNPVVEGYTKVSDCLGCHAGDTPAATTWQHDPKSTEINHQWANSGHAGKIASATPDTATVWGHYNWDQTTGSGNRGSCQRCHTATGAMNFLDSPATYNQANNDFSHLLNWTAATGSQQNELLYCWGCHSEVANGTLRNPGAITETYDPAVIVTYPDAFNSNVCMGCHLGREVGEVIRVNTDADGVLSFINSHYLTAGATIFSESGYEYAGQDYSGWAAHAGAGSGDGNGPCVTCHMTGAESHKFEVVQKDAAGVITAAATTACGECHGNMNAVWLEERKEAFHTALDALKQALEAKGIYFAESYPYFFTAPYVEGGTNTGYTNWAAPYGVPAWKDVMGAAFNYNLFEHDPGAYAHNRSYALKLIADSIDFLADGAVDGAGVFTINSVLVDLLATAQAVEETTIDAKHFDGEVLVKAQFVAPPTSIDAGGGDCSDCHAGSDPTANGVIVDQFAESAHGDVTGEAWWHYDWRIASRASCARCHNATAYVAKLGIESDTTFLYNGTTDSNLAGEVLSCAACHTNVSTGAVRAPGAYTETYNDGATYTFPDIGKSNLCIRCHSGRDAGSSIAASADADGVLNFINSHYLTAGGTVFTTTGYEYVGQDYANVAFYAHDQIGLPDVGPCAGCHMGTGTADHTWEVVAKDAAGVITAINSNTCISCHTGGFALTAAGLETEVEHYHAALEALKTALDAKGIYFYNAYPYFFTAPYVVGGVNTGFTDWASVYGLASWKDLMGAAFNYNLLHHDPGGYAHNRFYSKRLIYDAIDFIEDGVVNGTINVTGDAALYLDGDGATAGVQRP